MNTMVLNVNEVIDQLRMSRSRLYKEVRAGRLVPRKNGRRTVFLRREVERYVAGLPVAQNSPHVEMDDR